MRPPKVPEHRITVWQDESGRPSVGWRVEGYKGGVRWGSKAETAATAPAGGGESQEGKGHM